MTTRIVHSLITAIILGYIVFISTLTLGGMYIEFIVKPEPGNMDLLLVLMAEVVLIPILVLILFVVFYRYYHPLNVPLILFSAISGIWLTELVQLIFQLLPMVYSMKAYYVIQYFGLLNLIFLLAGYLFIRRKNTWLHINGFTIGTALGLLLSYGMVILLRWLDNTLTSFFWLDYKETAFVLASIFIGAWIGNHLNKTKVKKELASMG